MTKHTPGPWKVTSAGFDDTCDSGDACYYIAAPNGMQVSKANACMIEAAPDLLRALEDILPSIGWANYSDEELLDEAAKGNGTAPHILNARAAIAKARNT